VQPKTEVKTVRDLIAFIQGLPEDTPVYAVEEASGRQTCVAEVEDGCLHLRSWSFWQDRET
jgi:hypothetical protein